MIQAAFLFSMHNTLPFPFLFSLSIYPLSRRTKSLRTRFTRRFSSSFEQAQIFRPLYPLHTQTLLISRRVSRTLRNAYFLPFLQKKSTSDCFSLQRTRARLSSSPLLCLSPPTPTPHPPTQPFSPIHHLLIPQPCPLSRNVRRLSLVFSTRRSFSIDASREGGREGGEAFAFHLPSNRSFRPFPRFSFSTKRLSIEGENSLLAPVGAWIEGGFLGERKEGRKATETGAPC